MPIIFFKNTLFLSKKAKSQLDSVVKIAEQYPFCNLSVKGFGKSSVKSQQKSWDQVSSVSDYLIKRGILPERLIFNYCELGASNMVQLYGTKEKPVTNIGCPIRKIYK